MEKWDKIKAQNQLLAERLLSFPPDSPIWPIGERMSRCANVLFFGYAEDGERRLRNTSYCRARLCPVCQWRRSLKVRAQMNEILEHVERARGLRYVMLTLTVRNCRSADLRPTLKNMLRAWGQLTLKAWFKKYVSVPIGQSKSALTHWISPAIRIFMQCWPFALDISLAEIILKLKNGRRDGKKP